MNKTLFRYLAREMLLYRCAMLHKPTVQRLWQALEEELPADGRR